MTAMQAEEQAPLKTDENTPLSPLVEAAEPMPDPASASTVDGAAEGGSASPTGSEEPLSPVREEQTDAPRAPKVQTLTADDPGMLAREQAYREERSEGLGIGPLARTLAQEDPSVAARHAAYQARKEKKKAQGRNELPAKFLSNLPETEEDVNYRFNFIVRGIRAEEVTCAVCNSNGGNEKSSSSPSHRRDQGYRCICRVSSPMEGLLDADKDKPKLAKLIFRPIGHWEDVPVCSNRAEALSTVVVTAFEVDGEGSVEEQLRSLHTSVQNMRARSRPKRRPVRAVLLLCGGSSTTWQYGSEAESEPPYVSEGIPVPTGGKDGWAAQFADFESEHGDLWKFGPFNIQNKEALHAAFSEMASVRIAQNGLGKDGKVDDEEPEENELALDEEEEKAALFASEGKDTNDGNDGRPNDGGSSNASACSEGWHRPPVFDTEVDGSECSENALELHGRIFGMEEQQALLAAKGARKTSQDETQDDHPPDDRQESTEKEQRWDLGCCCISRRSERQEDHQSPRTVNAPPPQPPTRA